MAITDQIASEDDPIVAASGCPQRSGNAHAKTIPHDFSLTGYEPDMPSVYRQEIDRVIDRSGYKVTAVVRGPMDQLLPVLERTEPSWATQTSRDITPMTGPGYSWRSGWHSGKQLGKNMLLNLALPEGAEVPAALTGPGALMAANYYGAQGVLATEALTGMSAGVSYSGAGALTLGGAFAAAGLSVGFAGTGLFQVVRQSPQLGYAPANGYSTGYFDNFREMYCFWCD